MGKIVLARIDDRLIHGQVMTAWVQYTNATEIIIIDKKVADDPFLSDIITAAVPSKMKAFATSPIEASKYIIENEKDDNKYLLLAKGPQAFIDLINNGILLDSIDLGGMGQKGDRTQLYRNIAANEIERECFKNLLSKKINVYIQVVPANKKIILTNTILK